MKSSLLKEIKKMHEEEEKLGLNEDEIAFYYALSKDEVVKEFYDDETLKKIAQELTDAIRRNVTIDFNVRVQAQAAMNDDFRYYYIGYYNYTISMKLFKKNYDRIMVEINKA